MELKSLIRLSLIGISFAVIANGANVDPDNNFECPATEEYGEQNKCFCYKADKYLTCDSMNEPFKFSKFYVFNLVSLKNTKSYTFLLDESSKTLGKNINTSSLNLLEDTPITDRKDFDDFETVLQLPSDGIKIIMTTGPNEQIIDIDKLQRSIKTISLTNIGTVKNAGSNILFQKFPKLQTLHLENVNFSNTEDMVIFDGSLTDIQLKKTNIKGDFLFTPKNCPERNEHIRIDLSENWQLTNFSFDSLFKTVDGTCDFHIDLSNSPDLNVDFLENQADSLIEHISDRYFHLQLQDTPVNCRCGLTKLKNNPNVKLYGVYCIDHGFLHELNDNEICSTTATTPTTTLTPTSTSTTPHTPI